MNILLYEPVGEGNNTQFHRMIEGLDLECGMEIYRTIESLSQRLRQPEKKLTVAVLFATSSRELLDWHYHCVQQEGREDFRLFS